MGGWWSNQDILIPRAKNKREGRWKSVGMRATFLQLIVNGKHFLDLTSSWPEIFENEVRKSQKIIDTETVNEKRTF